MPKVFVSYNRQSQSTAGNLVNDIEALGYDVWFDQELSGGQAWWDRILGTIRDCDVFVFLLDPEGLNSTACRRELGYAVDLGKPVLPVLVAEGVSTNLLPPELSRIQFVDYRKQDRASVFALARALACVPPAKPLPDPLPFPPEVPVSYLGTLTRKIETAASLNYEEQSAIFLDLRRSLRNFKTSRDARILLGKLRSRRDLFATVGEEIDELLGTPEQAKPVSSAPEPKAPTNAELPRPDIIHVSVDLSSKVAASQRWRGAFAGVAIGAMLGLGAFSTAPNSHDIGDWVTATGIAAGAGALTGAISGMRRRVNLIAFAGLILGFSLWMIVDTNREWRFVRAVILAGSMGAVLGAAVGTIRLRHAANP